MDADHAGPWNPDHRWADPLITLLVLLVATLLAWRMAQEQVLPVPPSTRITAQARLIELRQAAKELAPARASRLLSGASLRQVAEGASDWDRAIYGVLAAEEGNLELGRSLAMEGAFPGGEGFRHCFAAAYLGEDLPQIAERSEVRRSLRYGYAAFKLEARLLDPSNASQAQVLREESRNWALRRLAALAAAGSIFAALVPVGIAMGIVLAISPGQPPLFPIPRITMPGRALALAFLGWFLVFLLASHLINGLAARSATLRPYALPLTYAFHAATGLTLLSWMEGLPFSHLWRRWMPGAHGKSLAWGMGFLALAVVTVLAVAWLVRPFMQSRDTPQRELMDLVAGTEGGLPLAVLFLTVAAVAPIFEECLFRGTLLPWLGHRLAALLGHRAGWWSALLLTGLAFGLIHLQPIALPVLSTLGVVLGLAFLRTGNLWSAILVHGLWNGGVFLFYRTVMG